MNNDEWKLIVASLQGKANMPNIEEVSYESVKDLEGNVRQYFADHPEENDRLLKAMNSYEKTKKVTRIEINEQGLGSELIIEFFKYDMVLEQFKNYYDHRKADGNEFAHGLYLMPLLQDLLVPFEVSGRFKGAVKFLKKDPKFANSRPNLNVLNLQRTQFPYSRIFAQDFDPDIGDGIKVIFNECFDAILKKDPIMRYEYSAQIRKLVKEYANNYENNNDNSSLHQGNKT